MELRAKSAHIALAVSTLLASGQGASADMGRAPGSQSGSYASIAGGYLLQNADGVIGYGYQTSPSTIEDVTLEANDGWFIEGVAGYAGATPFIGGLPFSRIEIYGLFGSASDSTSDTAPPAAGIALKNDSATLLVTGGASGFSTTDRETIEGGVSFKADSPQAPGTTLTWVLTPFVRWMGEDTTTTVTQCCILQRDADVDTWMYGVLFAVEPEADLSSQVSLVARIGAGIYGYQADGKFVSSANQAFAQSQFGATVSDSDSGVGFRGVLGLGLKFKLGPGTNLETFAQADYFSDSGTGHIANNQPSDDTASHVGSASLWELRGGARVSIVIGP